MKKRVSLFLSVFLLTLASIGFAASVYIVAPEVDSATRIRFSGVLDAGAILAKPACEPGMDARIFVSPARLIGGTGTSLVSMAGISTSALDNGDGTWRIEGQIMTGLGVVLTNENEGAALKLLVMTRCCATGTNCE